MLAQFKSELIHDYQNGSSHKVVYRNYQLKIDDALVELIENNLAILDKGLSYTKQISFIIIESLLDYLNLTYDIVEGNEVILDENDKIIGRYITNKYGLLGLDNSSEQIYKYQEGTLLITSNAFDNLKDFFDSPNSNLFMSDYKTFIFHSEK